MSRTTCVVDTNVPKTANLATQADPNAEVPPECVMACIEAVENVVKGQTLVIDERGDIFQEYMNQLFCKGQPGVGDQFMKWVYDHQYDQKHIQLVKINKSGGSYDEFPHHRDLEDFDPSDRKFVAVANAHADKPPILQATDCKWLKWKDALAEVGITVQFLCEAYVKTKYKKKMKT